MIKPEDYMDEMDLSVRSYNCLKRAGCQTVEDAVDLFTSGRLVKVRGAGRRVLKEVEEKLKELGFLKEEETE